MARRQLANIRGIDPEYTRKFQATKPEPPTQEHPESRAPVAAKPTIEPNALASEPAAADASFPVSETTPQQREGQTPKKSRTGKATERGKRGPKAVSEKSEVAAPPKSARSDGIKSVIDVRLSALERHQADLDKLAVKGLPTKDVMIFAGKRMLAAVELIPTYVPPSDEKRLTIAQYAYRSTKAVEDAIINALARKHDPLGVRGKYAMVQGQFEAQFWDELDSVIKELMQRD